MRITDWDDAYANREHIPQADAFIARWPQQATAFRTRLCAAGRARPDLAYGPRARNLLDLFLPEGRPAGLVVFVHGGYWRAFDKSLWSAFAEGPLAAGWAVAMPSYTLAPDATIAAITQEVLAAIAFAAAEVEGPIRLAGHSAGGHLAARALCTDADLPPEVAGRIVHTVAISAVADLRPLLRTAINDDLRLDEGMAAAESPALLSPRDGVRLTAWVGGAERPEFIRQSRLLANVWTGLGADTAEVVEDGRHHFDVIDGLATPDSALTRCLLG